MRHRVVRESKEVHGEPPFVFRMHWGHEPRRCGAPASGTAPGVIGTENRPCRRPAFRFMESLLGLATMHWDHEPRALRAGRKAPINRTHSRRFARFGDARRPR